MDIEKFKSDLKGKRFVHIVDLCVSQKDWFKYDWLVEASVSEAEKRHRAQGRNTKGTPCLTHRAIRYLIKMGFLIADPVNELRVSKHFIPRNQR